MVAYAFALRQHGLPSINSLACAFTPQAPLFGHADNQAMMRVVATGKNPSLRYIGRTHGTDVAWLHETHNGKCIRLAYEVSSNIAADIHTKSFTDAVGWTHALQLANTFDPAELVEASGSCIAHYYTFI